MSTIDYRDRIAEALDATLAGLQTILARQEGAVRADFERDHGDADDLLCQFFRDVGRSDIADAFDAIDKWYA